MKNFRIYVEGGGDSSFTLRKCRVAFRRFFEKIMPRGKLPKIIACGGRGRTYKRFSQAFNEFRGGNVILLVDSEGPVSDPVWVHLKNRDKWDSSGFSDESAQLMVQSMESWFLADKEALEEFYGQGFNSSSLPARENIEEISKNDVKTGLDNASRNTSKGTYHKTRHGFDILALMDPEKLDDMRVSKHAFRLFSRLRQLTC